MLLASPVFSYAQKKADKRLMDNLQQHVLKLSAGMTAGYLEEQFRAAGFDAPGDGYRQAVITHSPKQYSPGTTVYFHDTMLEAGVDFVPLPYSAQGEAAGAPLIAVQEENEPWFIDLANHLNQQPSYPDSLLNTSMYSLAKQAVADHAKAVLFYDSDGSVQLPAAMSARQMDTLAVPVLFINPAASKKYLADATASVDIKLKVAFSQKKDTAYNVIGALNNGAAQTVLIGAGHAEDQATLIELGRILGHDKHFSGENYLLVAFEGVGGLPGQRYFFEHPPVALSHISCFIRLDQDSSAEGKSTLTVGQNLSDGWKTILKKVNNKAVVLKQGPPSDDAPQTLPVLTFSSDHADNTVAADELEGMKYLLQLIREMNRAAN